MGEVKLPERDAERRELLLTMLGISRGIEIGLTLKELEDLCIMRGYLSVDVSGTKPVMFRKEEGAKGDSISENKGTSHAPCHVAGITGEAHSTMREANEPAKPSSSELTKKEAVKKMAEIEQAQTPKLDLSKRLPLSFWEEEALYDLSRWAFAKGQINGITIGTEQTIKTLKEQQPSPSKTPKITKEQIKRIATNLSDATWYFGADTDSDNERNLTEALKSAGLEVED
jgi:hypothetical protein